MADDEDKKDEQSQGGDPDALEKPTDLNALDKLSQNSDGEVQAAPDEAGGSKKPQKPEKGGKLRKLWGAMNVYLLIFLLLIVVAGVVFVVSYLNSQKEPELPETALQDLSQEELEEISSGDATVGDPRYILNIQSDAVFAGNALIRGDLNVAGSVQLGQPLTVPSISVSGTSNLNEVQINTLNVADAVTLQSALTLQDDAVISGNLSVGGSSTFNGQLTAASITTGNLTLAGNGSLTLNNHLNASSGATPGRSNGSGLGSGGSSSVSGSDLAGTVNIGSGNSPSSGCFVNLTFRQPYNGTPRVQITPVSPHAGSLNYYVTRNSNGFSVCGTNPQSGRTYTFDYFVTN